MDQKNPKEERFSVNIRIPAIVLLTLAPLTYGMERSTTPNSPHTASSPKATTQEDFLVKQAFEVLKKGARKNSTLSAQQISELQKDWQEIASAVGEVSVESNIEELEITEEEITPDGNAE